ncbi:site-specific recombinase XerD [Variovorax boronicumulans]|uniref:Site-specific recombinase XerD n=1 Tax=Variovorax boronicumulans TaxID=436515 RepID=A0AAW8DUS5_9BURK|nr:site-specific recombinase XerD [Variovorax boronicumulans]MDP9923211.1 site-specific recombinase XerD [Variovorax boronicumulans]
MSPLRQRLLDDMRVRKLRPKTQSAYVRAVRCLASFLQRSRDTATAEDLRRFQLHLVDRGVSPITLNATITGLKLLPRHAQLRRTGREDEGTAMSHPSMTGHTSAKGSARVLQQCLDLGYLRCVGRTSHFAGRMGTRERTSATRAA